MIQIERQSIKNFNENNQIKKQPRRVFLVAQSILGTHTQKQSEQDTGQSWEHFPSLAHPLGEVWNFIGKGDLNTTSDWTLNYSEPSPTPSKPVSDMILQ